MTIREKMLQLLHDRGLFESQAKGVLELYVSSSLSEFVRDRLDDEEDGYPSQLITAVWMGVSHSALEWIDKNKPQHWARPMFAK